tara:strand:+ start:17329 stop:19617 length:2289 start_codon:yes stop_codon:yes gene_type:complete
MKFGKELLALVLTLSLTGCAVHENQAGGQTQSALAQQDNTLAPSDASLPLYINNRLRRAERVLHESRHAEAVNLFESVLTVDPQNATAHAGLNQAGRMQRKDRLFSDASAAWKYDDFATAKMHLNALLAEYPSHPGALDLQARIADAQRPASESPSLDHRLQQPISLSFKEAALEQVFEVLSQTSEVNFLFDREVRKDQTVTIFLRKTTVAEAIDLILMTNQLERLVIDNNTMIVYPANSAKQREYQQLTVKAFQLIHGNAQNIANMLKSLLKARDIVIDERLNMLVMRDGAETIRLAEKLVALHDVPSPEVMLEVTVLEVKRSKLQDLGIRWPDQLTLTPLASSGSTLTLDDLMNLSSDQVGAGVPPLTINASKQGGAANILANPRIRAQNNETASVLIGERVPNITATSTATGFVSESVQYVDVGLKLDVQPTVFPNDEVAIKISLEVSNIIRQISTSSGSVVFQIGTRTASTTLRLRDGENQVLAGLITDELRNSSQAVPGLNDIPILGRLFASERDENQKTEVVLSITPRIVRNVKPPALHRSDFESGTEAAPMSYRPARPAEHTTDQDLMSYVAPPVVTELSYPIPARIAEGMQSETDSVVLAATDPVSTSDIDPRASIPSDISLSGPPTPTTGETFAVAVNVQKAGLKSIPLELDFDPDILEVVAIEEGHYFGSRGYAQFTYRVDRELGQVIAHATGSQDSATEAEPIVLNALFRARKPASSTAIDVRSRSAENADGEPVTLQASQPLTLSIADES